eukprot:11834149-Karenia_brevis.AAC.1
MSVATSVKIGAIISANVTILGTGPSMSVTDVGTNRYQCEQSGLRVIMHLRQDGQLASQWC